MSKVNFTARILFMACGSLLSTSLVSAQQPENRRPITVADTIEMTTVPEPRYAAEDVSKSRIAIFSPDNTHAVIVTERGVLESNEREFSLLLFDTSELFQSPKPKVLVAMRSRSNRDGIRNVKWLDDANLVFLGESRDSSQVYSVSLVDKHLTKLTSHPQAIVDFDFNPAKRLVVYAAEPTPLTKEGAYLRCARGYAITNQALDDIPRSLEDCKQPSLLEGFEVYIEHIGQPARQIAVPGFYLTLKPVTISPSGRFAIFAVLLRTVPAEWSMYEDPFIRKEALAFRNRGPFSWLTQYVLVDTATGRSKPLIDGPVEISQGATVWSPDGKTVAVSGAFLPIDETDEPEKQARQAHAFIVEVNPTTGEFNKISDKQLIASRWNTEGTELFLRAPYRNPERGKATYRKSKQGWAEVVDDRIADTRLGHSITLEQSLNSPPKIFVTDAAQGKQKLLLDLNPQFRNLEFAKVERITWKARDGHEVEGGLYYPPHFRPGSRYPLVIQTHGFSSQEFWINGPWNSAFAAQPLAARDIIVLQVGHALEKGADAKADSTPEEAPRQMQVIEGAVDYLDGLGIVDPSKIGIIGFSRTVYWVEYTLTHSSIHFAAATVADGFDGGYVQYLVNPYSKREWSTVNGGDPFGATFELCKNGHRRSPLIA